MKPIVKFNGNSQKRGNGYFCNLFNSSIIKDVCKLVTGVYDYNLAVEREGYNKGRLMEILYNDWHYYITFSEVDIQGRNSSMQSVPTALNKFFADDTKKKKLFYYFLANTGNPYTDYHKAYYRLLMTAGVKFLNIDRSMGLKAYHTLDEFISDRDENRASNRSNNSSYITKDQGRVQIFAKVYGASKYESTLFGIAASKLVRPTEEKIELYNIIEKDLKRLPQSSIKTLESLGNIDIFDADYSLEKRRFIEDGEKLLLRNPLYISHLLERLGHKHCALCGCEVPEIIQGAHIWSVSDIRAASMDNEEKFRNAISGHNGLWLCSNHHKLFDSNIIALDTDGFVTINNEISDAGNSFISEITTQSRIQDCILSDEFIHYVQMRNISIPIQNYHRLLA